VLALPRRADAVLDQDVLPGMPVDDAARQAAVDQLRRLGWSIHPDGHLICPAC